MDANEQDFFSPNVKPTVLIIDDSAGVVALLEAILRADCRVLTAQDAETGLKLAGCDPSPDLILLDVVMPLMDGFEICRKLKAFPGTRDIPVIFLTARSTPEDEERGLEIGAADYIVKPVCVPLVRARVKNHLRLKAASRLLHDQNVFLEAEVRRRTQELQAIQDVTVMLLTSLAEARGVDAGNHVRRTQLYVKALAQKLAAHPRYAEQLNEETISLICKAVPLHDIGKAGFPDALLSRKVSLRAEESEVVQTRARLGRDAVEHAALKLGGNIAFLRYAKDIAFCHQEKWDGTGCPLGIRGDEIPLSARLMAIADVYDALIDGRLGKEGFSHEAAVQWILRRRGTDFDPEIVDAFGTIADSFRAISRAYADEGVPPRDKPRLKA